MSEKQLESSDNATPNAHIETLPTRRPGQHPTDEERAAIQATFLESFATMANVSSACDIAGIDRSSVYRWVHDDESFAAKWQEAEEKANDVLRKEAYRRAVEGVPDYVISMGKLVTGPDGQPLTVKKYDTPLLMMLMRARMPEYRDTKNIDMNSTLNLNQSSAHSFNIDIRSMTPDELATVKQIAFAMKEREEQ
jgi:hypothetical protein